MNEELNSIEEVEIKSTNYEEDLNPIEKYMRDHDVSKNVFEFFLGKNVIAKIAGVLIFLGIVSFGQLAYEWMPDLGRVLLVFAIAVLLGVIGWWFERRNSEVFSNVFYAISVFTFYLVIILSRYQYELIDDTFLSYSSVGLMIASFLYFYKKRYSFLDSVLLIFYMVVWFIPNPYLHGDQNIWDSIEITLLVVTFGFILYMHLVKYLNDKMIIKTIMINILSIMFISYCIYLMIDSSNGLSYFEVMFTLMMLFFVYIVNIIMINKALPIFKFTTSLFTTILLMLVAINVANYLDYNLDFDYVNYIPLYIAVLLTPIYTFNYLKKNKEVNNVNLYYLLVIVFNLFLFGLYAGSNSFESSPYDFYYSIMVSGVSLIVFYLLSKITKEFIHKIAAYTFMIIFSIRLINRHITYQSFSFYQLDVILGSLAIGVVLLLINLFFKYVRKEEDEIDYTSVQTINLFLIIPVIIMLTREWINVDLSIIGSMVVLGFVGYRWLMELDIFKMKYKKEFLIGLNIKIVVVVFWVSLMYFDHNFALFNDVAKFLVVLAINIYIIQSLKELYYSKNKEMDDEWTFIIIYLIGVLIHSYFIHRYINIEFDKVILSSYFMIASAGGILLGFKGDWTLTRKLGLGSIYYSLLKFFIYDFYTQDFTTFVRMVTYFILGFTLLGISFLYAYLQKEYGDVK